MNNTAVRSTEAKQHMHNLRVVQEVQGYHYKKCRRSAAGTGVELFEVPHLKNYGGTVMELH